MATNATPETGRYTVYDLMRIMGRKKSSIYDAINRGDIPPCLVAKFGNQYQFPRKAFDDWYETGVLPITRLEDLAQWPS